eukprot:11173690-Lingulodinium_polyedra.AAC.1
MEARCSKTMRQTRSVSANALPMGARVVRPSSGANSLPNCKTVVLSAGSATEGSLRQGMGTGKRTRWQQRGLEPSLTDSATIRWHAVTSLRHQPGLLLPEPL